MHVLYSTDILSGCIQIVVLMGAGETYNARIVLIVLRFVRKKGTIFFPSR